MLLNRQSFAHNFTRSCIPSVEQKKYNIKIKGDSSSSEASASKEASSSGEGGQGILVSSS